MMNDGYFPVLSLHRDDVAHALALVEYLYDGTPSPYYYDGSDEEEDELGTEASRAAAANISDRDMALIAIRVGDSMMEGRDYWQAAYEAAYIAIKGEITA